MRHPKESGPADAIRASALTKNFASTRALRGVDLTVTAGESLALFGPNGAGKTTLMRVLSTAIKPTGGTFQISGLDPAQDDVGTRQSIGVISHQSFLYPDLSARQNLEFYAGLYGVDRPRDRVEKLLDLVELRGRADDAVRTFSRGMQQRVSFARSLVHEPNVLFLDEPFTGLDPHAADTLRRTLSGLRDARRTVVLTTHNLKQGLELSDRWAILYRGRIIDSGDSTTTDIANFDTFYFERIARSQEAEQAERDKPFDRGRASGQQGVR